MEGVSIIIPTYNRGYIIANSINSILKQTYYKFELIIIDDYSSDQTEEIVRNFNDRRIKYIKLDKNVGANKARNIGVNISKYKLIAFQDSDDIWHNSKLEEQIEFKKKTGLKAVFCRYNQYIDNEFRAIIPVEEKYEKFILLKKNMISTQTLLIEKKIFNYIKFDENLPRFQDWEFAIRLSENIEIGYLPKVLVDVFIQENSITKNAFKGYEALKLIEKKHRDKYLNKKKYHSSILAETYKFGIVSGISDKQCIYNAVQKNITIKNIILLIVAIFNLESLLKIYFKKKGW